MLRKEEEDDDDDDDGGRDEGNQGSKTKHNSNLLALLCVSMREGKIDTGKSLMTHVKW